MAGRLQDADHVKGLLEAGEYLIATVWIYRSVLVRAVAVHFGRAKEAVRREGGGGNVVFVWIGEIVVVVVIVVGAVSVVVSAGKVVVGRALARIVFWGNLGEWSAISKGRLWCVSCGRGGTNDLTDLAFAAWTL